MQGISSVIDFLLPGMLMTAIIMTAVISIVALLIVIVCHSIIQVIHKRLYYCSSMRDHGTFSN